MKDKILHQKSVELALKIGELVRDRGVAFVADMCNSTTGEVYKYQNPEHSTEISGARLALLNQALLKEKDKALTSLLLPSHWRIVEETSVPATGKLEEVATLFTDVVLDLRLAERSGSSVVLFEAATRAETALQRLRSEAMLMNKRYED